MTLTLIAPTRDCQPWAIALKAVAPDLDVQIWPHEPRPTDVEFALSWQHPAGVWQHYPHLRCVSSMGAGVDHLLADPTLPVHLPIVRLVDPLLAQAMFEYIGAAAMAHLRAFDQYQSQQVQHQWHPHPLQLSSAMTVGLMGLGQLGTYAAHKLKEIGFQVTGWSRTPKAIAEVNTFAGDAELSAFLAQTQILVCLLPLTRQTTGILYRTTFYQLPRKAYVINVARGEHLVEADLLATLDDGHLSGACLDVFRQDPLPEQHPFWSHPRIRVTPHCSSVTDPTSVATQIVENYRRLKAGQPLLNEVSRSQGY